MANKKSSKISLALVYAALEMILIVLLFINGFLSYVIGKFADRFRLKKPCLWCSRIDHVFEAGRLIDCRSLLCIKHSLEISRLRYCFNHKRLADSNVMCRDCFSSERGTEVLREENGLYSLINNADSEEEFGDCGMRMLCSCCGTSLEKKVLFLDCDSVESERADGEGNWVEGAREFGGFTSPKPAIIEDSAEEDSSPRPHLEFFIEPNSQHLIPVESRGENESKAFEKKAETKYELIAEEDGDLQGELSLQIPESCIPEAENTTQDVVSVENRIPAVSKNEADEAIPDTPTSIESFHHMHKKLETLERRESWAESIDGSMISDMDTGDTTATIEKLKSALRTERKTLRSLYEELEEERNASAVAANQTMAMINRLQEEKAGMQMEALHYQRMMDEQTEYDQEALQLLNELMRKREIEKEELERELTYYRKRLEDEEGEGDADSGLYLESLETERESILQHVRTLENKFGSRWSAKKDSNNLNGHGCDVEDEVGHVYERLHALEEEWEFLKQCILTMRKGGKGVHLLEEILHHLRDLTTVQKLV